jgi:sec-independent protein translocase protein TatA
MIGGLGTTELIIILIIVFVIFGAGKLPEIGSAMGKAIKSFKKSVSETEIDITPKEEEKEKIEAGTKEARKEETEEPKKQEEHAG